MKKKKQPVGVQSTLFDDVSKKLILSIYDFTGAWAQPWIDNGYPVMLWDKKVEGDILDERAAELWLRGYEEYVYGVLLAPPCTDFAGSGARWWKDKDKNNPEGLALSVELVEFGMFISALCPNLKFWVLENPVGRIETLVPELKEFRRMSFNPCDFGDPYTKKTILWGHFNSNLVKTPVEPEFTTYNGKDGRIVKMAPQFARTGGKSEKTKAIRSATPSGFARAFYEANKYQGNELPTCPHGWLTPVEDGME